MQLKTNRDIDGNIDVYNSEGSWLGTIVREGPIELYFESCARISRKELLDISTLMKRMEPRESRDTVNLITQVLDRATVRIRRIQGYMERCLS